MNNQETKIRKEVKITPLTVSRVYKSDFQKEGTLTAELRQEVITTSFYPTKVVANSLQDNVFTMSDFGFKEEKFVNTEKRVAWIDVPANSTVESVATKLKELKDANLYKILSNHPILSDTEEYAIKSPELNVTLDTFANRQVIRYPEGHENAGELALHKDTGKVQYRRIAFAATGKSDVDNRTEDPTDFYASAEIKAELNHENVNTIPSQSI